MPEPDGHAGNCKEILRRHAESLGRAVYDSELGIGIEFGDGCDAFWVLPGEVISTVAVPAEGPESVDDLINLYTRLDELRGQALHVIRHYLADRKYIVERVRTGEWWLKGGGVEQTLCVGASLTGLAREAREIHDVVRTCFKHAYIKPPSPKRIDRYLATAGLPENEREPEFDRQEDGNDDCSIPQALRMLGLCKALEDPENFTSAERLERVVSPDGPIGQALLRMGQKLPEARASVDLCAPGALVVEFDDGFDSFTVNTRSRRLARRIRESGPERVGDELEEEYRSLNAARAQVLRAVDQAAMGLGWGMEEMLGLGLLGVKGAVYLGERYREVGFDPAEELTRLLRRHPPEEAVGRMFADRPDFAERCLAALRNPLPAGEVVVQAARLLPKEAPRTVPLRGLTPDVIAELDAFARRTLQAYLQQEDTLWNYRNRDVYDPAVDDWATQEDWVRLAERTLNDEWVHPVAALVLLDAGDPRGDEIARRFVSERDEFDVEDADVELMWRYRREVPDKAREWFHPGPNEDVPFAEERAPLGDPVAQRHIAFRQVPDKIEDLDELAEEPEAVASLDPHRQEQVHRALLYWARTDHHWAPPSDDKLRVALRMGWCDVAEAMQENPYMLPVMLDIADRGADQFDEPGVLLGDKFLLIWSKLDPSSFLARLLATARSIDLVERANEASRRSAAREPNLQSELEFSAGVYKEWQNALEPSLAIAWTRCRRNLV